MVVHNNKDLTTILIREDRIEKGTPERDKQFRSVVLYQYVRWKNNRYVIENHNRYHLSFSKATQPVWSLEGYLLKKMNENK